jgi:hypothetical protein
MNQPKTLRPITGTEHDGNYLFLQHDGYDLAVVKPCERDGDIPDLSDEEQDAWAAQIAQALDGYPVLLEMLEALRAVDRADSYIHERGEALFKVRAILKKIDVGHL